LVQTQPTTSQHRLNLHQNSNLVVCRKKNVLNFRLFSDSFSDEPGKTTLTKHGIHLQPGTTPIKLSPYRVSSAKADVIKKKLDDMLKLGVIEPSTTPWSAPVVLIPKPDKTLRFCVDYRRLNKVTIPDAFPMPRIDDLIDKVGKAKFLTKIDLSKGYWQVPLQEEAVPISAFVTPFGHFQWKYMPFGLRNAPATFQTRTKSTFWIR